MDYSVKIMSGFKVIGYQREFAFESGYTEIPKFWDEVPDGMTVYEFPDMEWVKFRCVGPMPGALQSVNTKIFKEWLPGNAEFEIAMGANIEWYSAEGNTTDVDYESGIWVPVKRKQLKVEWCRYITLFLCNKNEYCANARK